MFKTIKNHKVITTAIIVLVAGIGVVTYVTQQPEEVTKPKESVEMSVKEEQISEPKEEVVEPVEVVESVEVVSSNNDTPTPYKQTDPVKKPVERTESPVSSDEEFFELFFLKVREQHEETHLMSNSSAYNSIYRLYKNNPSIFLPSKTDSIISTCLSQIKSEPEKFIYICNL